MLYQISNGVVSYGGTTVLENINFEIRNNEKIAIVGRNGCGKTTLLKLINGEVELDKRDSDEDIFIAKSGKPVIGYLKQIAFEDEGLTMEAEVMKAFDNIRSMEKRLSEITALMEKNSDDKLIMQFTALSEEYDYAGGYTWRKEYETVIKKFGFTAEDTQKKLSEFSGGQKTKIAFAKMLLSKPDILLLDEPTNHLDLDTITWLEGYLRDYKKAVVIVSHDRMFIDRIVSVVYEIEYGATTRYAGNYADFTRQKKENWEKQYKDHRLQEKEIARLTALIERFKNKPTKVAMTRSKMKAIEHMNLVPAPARYNLSSFHANFKPERESVSKVLSAQELGIGYNGQLLHTVTVDVLRGRKVGIIGDNGTGKSTFLKTVVGLLPMISGEYQIGANTDVGYFDQQIAQYESSSTIIDDFWNEFPSLTENEVRSALGAFMFTGEDVFKNINMLSGGEKVRLALCKIFKTKPNFLILDEPTNHMDIVGKETLEAMLKAYAGTVVFVSHDRYFIREVADSLLIFDKEKVTYFPYDYNYYLEKTSQENAKEDKEADLKQPSAPKKQYYNPGREESKIKKKVEKIEALISEYENRISELKSQYEDESIQSDYEKLSQIDSEISQIEDQIAEAMEEWESLQS